MTNKKETWGNAETKPNTIKQVSSKNTTFNFKYLSGDGFGIVGGV